MTDERIDKRTLDGSGREGIYTYSQASFSVCLVSFSVYVGGREEGEEFTRTDLKSYLTVSSFTTGDFLSTVLVLEACGFLIYNTSPLFQVGEKCQRFG